MNERTNNPDEYPGQYPQDYPEQPGNTLAVNDSGSDFGRKSKIRPGDRRKLCRDLALAEVKRTTLATKYGVSGSYITRFAKQYAAEIDAIRKDLDNEFAGMWIAQKQNRIDQYQEDLEMSKGSPYSDHYEQIRTRTQILRNVAEEMGQLPTRGNITVVPVQHVIVGIEMDDLR